MRHHRFAAHHGSYLTPRFAGSEIGPLCLWAYSWRGEWSGWIPSRAHRCVYGRVDPPGEWQGTRVGVVRAVSGKRRPYCTVDTSRCRLTPLDENRPFSFSLDSARTANISGSTTIYCNLLQFLDSSGTVLNRAPSTQNYNIPSERLATTTVDTGTSLDHSRPASLPLAGLLTGTRRPPAELQGRGGSG